MRVTLALVCLAFLGVGVHGGLIRWLEGGDDRPQADQPSGQSQATDVLRVIQELGRSFRELAGRRNSWLDRYTQLANDTARNSAVITELLDISKVAMPVVWNAFASKVQMQLMEDIAKGGSESFYPPSDSTTPAPHPLKSISTEYTDDQEFTVAAILLLKEEANVGIRLMYEPDEGHEFDWENDDIYFAAHIRWHFSDGPDREVALTSKEGGEWIATQTFGEEQWPNLNVNEKFAVTIEKRGSCIKMTIMTGEAIALVQPPSTSNYHAYDYCPQPRTQPKEGRHLRMVVNEDNPGAGQLQVSSLAWFPVTL